MHLSIDFLGIHLLHCAHDSESTNTPDDIHDAFASIAKEAIFMRLGEQLHVPPKLPHFKHLSIVSTLSFQRMGVYTLENIIIVDLTHVNLLSQASKT
jgi:hypothetical protein